MATKRHMSATCDGRRALRSEPSASGADREPSVGAGTRVTHAQAKEHMMYARLTTGQIQPGKLDEFSRIFASLTPQLNDVKGLVSMRLLCDRTASTAVAESLYETMADMEAGTPLLQQTLANPSVAALLAGPPVIA